MIKQVLLLAFAMAIFTKADVVRQKPADDDPNCIKKCKGKPMELSFVVDSSSSIYPENFTYGLNFIEDFVDEFDISPTVVRVSMVTYGDVVYTNDAFGFDRYDNKADLKQAISEIVHRGGSTTNTSGGIWYMLRHQMSQARTGIPDLRRVVVVITDGNSQERELTKEAANDALEAGLEVFAIGVGKNVSLRELHNIASDNHHVFVVSTYNMLDQIKERLKYKACASVPEPVCKLEPMDLSFVIDSSSSIGEGNFSVGMTFVNNFLDSFQINPSTVRVSAVTYGDRVYTEDAFGFNDHRNKKDLMDTLEAIQWRHGSETRTWEGIRFMRQNQMAYARESAAHVCIVITDGASQEPDSTAAEALEAQNAGIVMYAVGIGEMGKQLNEAELVNIAGDPDRVLTATSYAQLNLLKIELATKTCEGVVYALEQQREKYRV